MVSLKWREEAHHGESLAVSLRAILASRQREYAYEEIAAMLGLGAAIVAAPNEPLGAWPSYARDAALEPAGRVYGLRLRALHPAGAAVGLQRSLGFAQHFRDSYVPLIEHAVRHDQPVLAWRGWPPPRARLWGVIQDVRSGMVVGSTLWHKGQPLPMIGAAHQVYVVEQIDDPPRPLEPDGMYRQVKDRALAVWRQAWGDSKQVRSGPAAYEAWEGELASPASRFDPSPLAHQHAAMSRAITSARRCLAVWLRGVGGSFQTESIEEAAHWSTVCDQVADTLEPQATPAQVQSVLSAEGGTDALIRAVQRARELEAAAIDRLRSADADRRAAAS